MTAKRWLKNGELLRNDLDKSGTKLLATESETATQLSQDWHKIVTLSFQKKAIHWNLKSHVHYQIQ